MKILKAKTSHPKKTTLAISDLNFVKYYEDNNIVLKDLYKTRNFAQDIEGKKEQDKNKKVEKEKSKGLMSKEGDDE